MISPESSPEPGPQSGPSTGFERNRTVPPPRNTTVLPYVDSAGASVELKPRNETRYQRIKRLGSGAMGEVNLVLDNDIGRTVAMKQLVTDAQNPAGLLRFIAEIRTIGRLEHPNIVPIHDVGVDEQGQIFFVMKHIDGETLESILEKLDAGDPAYMERFTLDVRIEIFLGLLRALQFAHAQGVVHRGQYRRFSRRENRKLCGQGTRRNALRAAPAAYA